MVLFCGCAYSQIIPAETKAAVLGALEVSDVNFRIVPDICRAAAHERDFLKKLAGKHHLKIVACYSRAAKWLLEWAGVDTRGVEFFNMRSTPADEIIAELIGDNIQSKPENLISTSTDWVPWFPVIDRDLCTNCKQCLNFCLFGVYSLVDSRVEVTDPKACKTNCPACAKVCPRAAIIFPKYEKSPVNGDVVDEKAIKAVNLEALMDGDLQEKLRQRGKKRFAPAVSGSDKFADLKKMQDQLDIPQDVIDSLSPGNCPNSDFCDNDCKKDTDGQDKP